VGLLCGPWLGVAEGIPDVVGATGAQAEVPHPIPFDRANSVFPDSAVEATLWAFVFRNLNLPTGVPESPSEANRIV